MKIIEKIITSISDYRDSFLKVFGFAFEVFVYYLSGGFQTTHFKKQFRDDGSLLNLLFAGILVLNCLFLFVVSLDLIDFTLGLSIGAHAIFSHIEVPEYNTHSLKVSLRLLLISLIIPCVPLVVNVKKEEERKKKRAEAEKLKKNM